MKHTLQLVLKPEIAYEPAILEKYILDLLAIKQDVKPYVRQLKRSIDARGREIKVNLELEVFLDETPPSLIAYQKEYKNVSKSKQAIIIGAGPAGLFAGLRMLELGIKPIILERGKDVRARRRDIAALNKEHIVDEDSNYCFGEGGAGTYSDGKLYTRSKKRGDIRKVLEIMVAHGAIEDILVDAHPHIGTNKLPQLIENIRESILNAGGEIRFETKIEDFIIQSNEIKAVISKQGETFEGIGVILATGHSARDIFYLLENKKILIEAKPFALGVRIEHLQSQIDRIQYHSEDRGKYLPASSYSLVHQANFKRKERGVFSFCMCPGGFIVPSATHTGEVVVNGMSPSRRDSKYSNSGIVVSIDTEDAKAYQHKGNLMLLAFQQDIEQKACLLAGNTQLAPAQRMTDFVNRKVSSTLLPTSYQPGLSTMSMDEVLPEFIAESLREGLIAFGKKMRGYLTEEAQIVGVESRTSSPVRIPRDKESYEHMQIQRLYPCGEGAGYAGGIMSAAMDGIKSAEKLIEKYF